MYQYSATRWNGSGMFGDYITIDTFRTLNPDFFKAENEPIVTIDSNKYCIDRIKAWSAWDLFVEIAWNHDVDPHEGWEEKEIISWLHRWNYVFDVKTKIWILAKDIWSNKELKPIPGDMA